MLDLGFDGTPSPLVPSNLSAFETTTGECGPGEPIDPAADPDLLFGSRSFCAFRPKEKLENFPMAFLVTMRVVGLSTFFFYFSEGKTARRRGSQTCTRELL